MSDERVTTTSTAEELGDADLVVSSLAYVVFEVVDGRVRVRPPQP